MTLEAATTPLQYITSESGQRVGVLISWQDFQQLRLQLPDDPDVLHGLSIAELQALANGMLSPEHQEKLSDLLQKNENEVLSREDAEELDQLLEQIDSLSILKARARLTAVCY